MAFDGSGTYSLTYTWATEAASPPIAISKLDTEFAGVAAALSQCVLRNGNGKPTAATDWNAQKITNLGNATEDADALNRVTADGRYTRAAASGNFTVSLRENSPDGSVIATGTAYWIKHGNLVTLRLPPSLWGSSTAFIYYLTGLPADIQTGASISPTHPVVVTDNGTVKIGFVVINAQTSHMALALPPSGFTTSSGNKGLDYSATLTYAVAN